MAESTELLAAFGVVRETASGMAWVEPEQQGCGRCDEPGGCGGAGKGDLACASPRRVRVRNDVGAQVGDRVRIETVPGSVSRAASLGYVLPLIGLLVGALLGQSLASGELAAMVGAVAGGAAGWQWARRYSSDAINEPRIVKSFPGERHA